MAYTENEYLAHYGVKGMRKGVRRGPRTYYQIGMSTMQDPDEERRIAATTKRSVSGINGARMGGYGPGTTQTQATRYGVRNRLWRDKDRGPRARRRVNFTYYNR